jgi:hypothetical protein
MGRTARGLGIAAYGVGIAVFALGKLSDPLLVAPNDLVAVGRDRLYVTNDHACATRVLEEYLGLPLSTVVHYDGERFVESALAVSGDPRAGTGQRRPRRRGDLPQPRWEPLRI